VLFERIRRTQKPVFIFLAAMFALGFVALGVGQGVNGINLGNLFSSGSSANGSLSSLVSQVESHPKDSGAWLQLARAYEAENQLNASISAYQSYLALKPKDQTAIAATAFLFEQRGQVFAQKTQQAQAAANAYTQVTSGSVANSLKLGSALTHPLMTTLATPAQTVASTLETNAITDYSQAMGLRQRLVKLAPRNGNDQLQLARDAYATQSYAIVAKALQAYVTLTPTLSKANKAKLESEIAQYRLLAKTSQSGSGGTGTVPGG
jgi:tetratricopeptide (TPR) repeat protein